MTTTTTTAKNERYGFKTSKEAWEFMRQCDARGIRAGYPDLESNAVEVLAADVSAADALYVDRPASYKVAA